VIVTEAGSSRSGRFLKLFFSQSSDVFSALAVLVTMRHINSRLHYITLQTVRCCQTEFVSVYQVLTKSSQCENCFCYKELKHDVKFVLYWSLFTISGSNTYNNNSSNNNILSFCSFICAFVHSFSIVFLPSGDFYAIQQPGNERLQTYLVFVNEGRHESTSRRRPTALASHHCY